MTMVRAVAAAVAVVAAVAATAGCDRDEEAPAVAAPAAAATTSSSPTPSPPPYSPPPPPPVSPDRTPEAVGAVPDSAFAYWEVCGGAKYPGAAAYAGTRHSMVVSAWGGATRGSRWTTPWADTWPPRSPIGGPPTTSGRCSSSRA